MIQDDIDKIINRTEKIIDNIPDYTINKNGIVIPEIDVCAQYIIDQLHPILYKGTIYVYYKGIYIPDDGHIRAMWKLETKSIRDRVVADLVSGKYAGVKINKTKGKKTEEAEEEQNIIITDEDLEDANIDNITEKLATVFDKLYSNTTEKNVVARVNAIPPTMEDVFNTTLGICFKNCVVLFKQDETGKFYWETAEHSYEYKFKYKVPHEFNPKATPDAHNALLEGWVPQDEDQRSLLLSMDTQAILQLNPNISAFKKAYIFQGEKNTGKSTCMNYKEWFFSGKHFEAGRVISKTRPRDYIKDANHAMARLEGCLFCLCDDLKDEKLGGGNFKALTGSNVQEINPKGKSVRLARISAVHVFSFNISPGLDQGCVRDTAAMERFAVVKFPISKPTAPDWEEKTFTETQAESYAMALVNHTIAILNNDMKLPYEQDYDYLNDFFMQEDPFSIFIQDNFIDLSTMSSYDKSKYGTNYIWLADLMNAIKMYVEDPNIDKDERDFRKKQMPNYKAGNAREINQRLSMIEGNHEVERKSNPTTHKRENAVINLSWDPASPYCPSIK